MALVGLGVDGPQVAGEILDEPDDLDHLGGTFSRQEVCARKLMSEARIFSADDVID